MMRFLSALLVLLFFTATPGHAQFADQATFVGTGGGTANAQTITIPNAVSLTNLRGVLLKYIPAASNTAATTLAVTGLTPTAILKPSNNSGLAALSGGEIRVGQTALLMYDGTEFVLFNVATGGALCGASGLTITNNGVSLVTISYNSATVVDAAGVATFIPSGSVTINLAAAPGPGALDGGSQTANTWYYAYLIYNGTAYGLGSTSSTAPAVPTSFYGTCRIGAFRANGAATLLNTRQLGNRVQYVVSSGVPLPSMSTSFGAYWSSIAVTNFVPPTATTIRLQLTCQNTETVSGSSSSTTTCGVAPNNSYGTSTFTSPFPPLSWSNSYIGNGGGTGTSTTGGGNVGEFVLESTSIYVGGNATTTQLGAMGWIDAVNAN